MTSRGSCSRERSPDRCAVQVADAVGEGQSYGAADDDPEHCTTWVPAADASADVPGDTKRHDDGDESDRDPPATSVEQDRQQWEQRPKSERQRGCERGLHRVGQMLRINVQFGIQVRRQRVMRGQLRGDRLRGFGGQALGLVDGGQFR